MKDVELLRTDDGLEPANDEAREAIKNYPFGSYVLADLVKPRNPQFHRCFFALLRFGYRYWEPPEYIDVDGVPVSVTKSFESFKDDVIIMAGFSEAVIKLNGEAALRPKSISFSNMEEGEFREVFKRVKDVIWRLIFSKIKTFTPAQYEQSVLEFMQF